MRQKKIYLFIPIFFLLFLVALSNTFWIINALIFFLITLLVIFLISILTDKFFKTNFKWFALTLFGVSVAGVLAGVLTYPIQEKWNLNKAERFIAKIENFNTENGRYPQSSYEIEIPISRNGFYEKEFEYYLPAENEGEYIIKYFDGFWNTKVYVSKENKWYTDD